MPKKEKPDYAKLNTKETPGVTYVHGVIGPTPDEWHRPADLPEDQPIPDMAAPPVDGSGAVDGVTVESERHRREREARDAESRRLFGKSYDEVRKALKK